MIDTKESQKYIIGCILTEPDTLLVVSDILRPEDMTHQNSLILSHAISLYAKGTPIDIASVGHSLQESREIDRVGGIGYLSDCMNIPTTANVKHHAKIVKEVSIKDKIKNWGKTVAERDLTGDVPELLGTLEQELIKLSDGVKPKKSPEAEAILKEIYKRQKRIDKAIESQDYKGIWIPTQFWGPNIPAYHQGHNILITGYTSYGKSTLLSSLIVDICENGGKALVFSLEDSRIEKLMGLRAAISNVPKPRQLQGDIQSSRELLADADQKLLKWSPIIYDDVRTLADMRLKIKKHVLRDGVNVVAIDFIQNIKERGSIYERMSTAAPYLQDLWKEMGVTGIVLSQIDNESAKGNSKLIGAKGGGDLPAAADIVVDMQRPEGDKFKMDLLVKKNRVFGKTGIIQTHFTKQYTAIEPYTF